ncbi:MAG: hypothetical protein RBR30_04065 [Tenuifilaceae bacterium]|nr:hypothetical protein [Tenuifilaceae bacterium]
MLISKKVYPWNLFDYPPIFHYICTHKLGILLMITTDQIKDLFKRTDALRRHL